MKLALNRRPRDVDEASPEVSVWRKVLVART